MRTLFYFTVACVFAGSFTGCAPWTQAQMDLVTQAQRGIALIKQSDAQRDAQAQELTRLRRQRLDEAFDQDVGERELLDPDWVIEARQAYAVALDALAKAQASSERAADLRQRNLADVDAALERLHWLLSIQSRFDLLKEER